VPAAADDSKQHDKDAALLMTRMLQLGRAGLQEGAVPVGLLPLCGCARAGLRVSPAYGPYLLGATQLLVIFFTCCEAHAVQLEALCLLAVAPLVLQGALLLARCQQLVLLC
jgi:hypothetical protein